MKLYTTLSLLAMIAVGWSVALAGNCPGPGCPGPHSAPPAGASNYTVDQGGTYKSSGQKPSEESKTEQLPKDDDTHDRSENDAGHGKTNQSTGADGDVLIDQSTYKNRGK